MPMYNSSKYLNESLGSIKKQSYKNYEVIIVDDGSTDNSVEVAERIIKKDIRFKIIKQKNSFAGVARNNGLKYVKGKYVIFLDADDIFDKKMLHNLVLESLNHDVDIIVFGYYSFSIKYINHKYNIKYAGQELSPLEIKKDLFCIDSGIPWNKFYKVDFIKNVGLKFQAIPNTNDVFFTKLSFACASKIYFSKKNLVYYRSGNPTSLQGSRLRYPSAFYTAYSGLIDALRNRNLLETFDHTTKRLIIDTCLGHLCSADNNELFRCMFDISCKLIKEIELSEDDEIIVNDEQRNTILSIVNEDYEACILYVYLNYKQNVTDVENKTVKSKIKKMARKIFI